MATGTKQKYADIRKAHEKWTNKKYKGVQIYNSSYILQKVAEKFYLSPTTIENIVFFRVGFKD